MEILFRYVGLVLILTTFSLLAFLASRGIGSRWIWLGGGIVGVLGLIVYSVVWDLGRRPASSGGWQIDYDAPPSLPLGGADAYCALLALGFVVAGLCYKPKKEARTNLLGNDEGRILNAGRANGKD